MKAPTNIRLRAQFGASATHKFAVGENVIHTVAHKRERLSFRVTRLMPDGGAGLQYRLRCDADGHERVVVETALEDRISEALA